MTKQQDDELVRVLNKIHGVNLEICSLSKRLSTRPIGTIRWENGLSYLTESILHREYLIAKKKRLEALLEALH
jgi:hypothetical protein